MGTLRNKAASLLQASLAPGTWDAYNRAIGKFAAFRIGLDLPQIWPAPVSDLVLYIAYLADKGWTHSTISVHMSALSFLHKINEWSDPTSTFIVKKLKEGSRRAASKPDSRRPITFSLLKKIVALLPSTCSSSYEVALFKCAFFLAFFGFLRVGEYACISKKKLSDHVIKVGDVLLSGRQSLTIHIPHSKTDQGRKGADVTILGLSDEFHSPLHIFRNFLAIRPPVAGPLFIHFNQEPLTVFQVSRMLKETIQILGLPKEDFSPHSFRIGAATSAAMRGVSDEEIQLMGRWKSSAFQTYIRPERLISDW